jgi:glutaconate CoA-transferase subunit B
VSATPRERMAILIAKELRDGEVVLTGAASAVPLAACLLAQRRHAPRLTVLGAGVYINPGRLVPEFTAGWDCHPQAVGDMSDVFAITEAGIDVMFYGGMQIDRHGSINLHEVHVGDRIISGPGLANTMLGHTARRTILYTERHETRTLVEQVDFATVVGHRYRKRSRADLGLSNEGPVALVTPHVLFRPDADGAFTVVLVHGEASWEELRTQTGWDIGSPCKSGEMDERRKSAQREIAEELGLLRSVIDPRGLLRQPHAAFGDNGPALAIDRR